MGVDNNGILFYGLPDKEVDLLSLEGLNLDPEDGDIAWSLEMWSREHGVKPALTTQPDNGYERRLTLVGFELADSGSYGLREIPDLAELIKVVTVQFEQLFGQPGKFYILNYQW